MPHTQQRSELSFLCAVIDYLKNLCKFLMVSLHLPVCLYFPCVFADWWDSGVSSLDDWNFPAQTLSSGVQSSTSNAKASSGGTRAKASSLSVSKGGGSALSTSSALSDGKADAVAGSEAISKDGVDATAIAEAEASAGEGEGNGASAGVNVVSTGGFSRGKASAISRVIFLQKHKAIFYLDVVIGAPRILLLEYILFHRKSGHT